MTKQEKIREGIASVIWDAFDEIWFQHMNTREAEWSFLLKLAGEIMEHEDSQGVVIKTEDQRIQVATWELADRANGIKVEYHTENRDTYIAVVEPLKLDK